MKKVAIVAPNGFLKQSTNGSAFSSEDVGIPVAPGTSPAVAVGPSDAMIAVNGAGGDLLLNRSSDHTANDTGLAIKAGTTPAIAALSNGLFQVAFVAPDDMLWLADRNGVGFSTGHKVVANSNPAIAAASTTGEWKIAFNSADNNALAFLTQVMEHTTIPLAPGTSPSIAAATPQAGTTTPPPPPPTILSMQKQNPGTGSFIPYVGKYPPFGNVPPFHLLGVQFPAFGASDQELFLVKPGHNTGECGDPNALIPLLEGQSLTSAQITTLWGSAQPHFTTLNPLTAVACYQNTNNSFPNFVDLNITIQND